MKRYIKNMKALSEEDMKKLFNSKVCVVGCGGLGGYIIEMLARIGVRYITAIDGDVFDETNLNRQLISHTENIGKSKVEEAMKRMKVVNPDVIVTPINEILDENNAMTLLKDHDVIVDALDNIKSRKVLNMFSAKLNIPMVHGAIAGFYGQVSTIYPEDNTFNYIYPDNEDLNKGIEIELGNPSFIPPLVAAIEVSEVIKILTNKGDLLRNKILLIDLLNNNFDIVEFK
ncbi:MAG: HesA/MoeB/ThiF family protein [Tissierellia bacterium]|nr:HesA/MoeB/ThiF family protein [Tissierellia bacterium]